MIGIYNEKAALVSMIMKILMVFLIAGVVSVANVQADSVDKSVETTSRIETIYAEI